MATIRLWIAGAILLGGAAAQGEIPTQNNVNNVFIDGQDNKWIATSEGFTVFDAQNNSTVYRTTNSLITSNNIRASVRDPNGNVWLTTSGGGLNKYKSSR